MKAVGELIYKMADDALIIGHRNSEWTGIGPTLEEDISFSSIAQDKLGHAFQLYTILHEQLGEKDPDTIAFLRDVSEFKCCQFVEMPIGDYSFSLVRQFLFDHAEYCRYSALAESSYEPLASLAGKIKGEIKYHLLHADVWIRQLGAGTEDSHSRIQNALDNAFPLALGIFEPSSNEEELISEKIFVGEDQLRGDWMNSITPILESAGFKIPDINSLEPVFGGRSGNHTEHLQLLLDEMGEVIRSEENATW